ncbi:YicC family protein [Virgibacillus sp. MSP4-1]|uniref:YicC/YloC family endoribonuclease n=1 Tax=Virgibacillus sp. MSP4-1 TaxID=2700081 RepID=UPI00137BAC7A|nr:YicC/YloC family endoribonuclease [Virgibacillus sp. MSP4-1]QHS22192.1 YicC family protein [Virgibacillus sp. MSP4-1]
MVKSMTGYGREIAAIGETRITVEVRTVNHRFLDLSIKMPKMLLYIEEKMKEQARLFFSRGRIDVMVSIEGEGLVNRNINIDWDLLDQYIEKLSSIQNHYQLSGSVRVQDILKLEDAFSIVEQENTSSNFEDVLLRTCDTACKKALEMREHEGNALYNDLKQRIQFVQTVVQRLEKQRDIIMEEYRQRIRQRMEEYLNEELHDERKMMQEVALLAEKGDITEEVTRLFSHIHQFLSTLEQVDEPIGRKLDFIVQEMHREVNTIGSKSNDGDLSQWVVSIKSEVEKLKEQIQNVE